jgi:hypothetical protein
VETVKYLFGIDRTKSVANLSYDLVNWKADEQCNEWFARCHTRVAFGIAQLLNNTTHGESIYRIMPWNIEKPCAIRHHDMFALSNNSQTSFFQTLDCLEMLMPGILGISDGQFDFS